MLPHGAGSKGDLAIAREGEGRVEFLLLNVHFSQRVELLYDTSLFPVFHIATNVFQTC
jgi:hypothetical protein